VNPEVAQALRRFQLTGRLTSERASKALARLIESQISRFSTLPLLEDAWSMRDNVSVYDACYVALARSRKCALLTTDRHLAGAPNLDVPLIVV
jgi:predicted nucleic acid-binding protein